MKLLIVEDSSLVSVRLKLAFGKIAALETEFVDRLELALERFLMKRLSSDRSLSVRAKLAGRNLQRCVADEGDGITAET